MGSAAHTTAFPPAEITHDKSRCPHCHRKTMCYLSVDGWRCELCCQVIQPDDDAQQLASPLASAVSPNENPPNPKQRHGDRKVNLALVPPAADVYMALAFTEGARKYGPYNWRAKSVEIMTYIGAAKRHLDAYLDGQDNDPDTGYPHIAHALACLGIIADATETGCAVDNRPPAGAASDLLKRYEKKPESVEGATVSGLDDETLTTTFSPLEDLVDNEMAALEAQAQDFAKNVSNPGRGG
jgi:hypothetical protein